MKLQEEMVRKALTSLAAGALAFMGTFVLPGCGGGSSSPPPTKVAYLKQVNEICQDGQNQHDRVLYAAIKKFQREGETDKVKEETMLALHDPYEETTKHLAELTPPKGGEPKVEALIEAREEAAERMRKEPLAAYDHPLRKAEERARVAGVTTCLV
jgi:hypothetical protein